MKFTGMGEDVKSYIRENFEVSDLIGLYTAEELMEIGFLLGKKAIYLTGDFKAGGNVKAGTDYSFSENELLKIYSKEEIDIINTGEGL